MTRVIIASLRVTERTRTSSPTFEPIGEQNVRICCIFMSRGRGYGPEVGRERTWRASCRLLVVGGGGRPPRDRAPLYTLFFCYLLLLLLRVVLLVVGLRHGHEEEDQPAAGGPQPRRGDHQHCTLSCLLGVWGLFLLLLYTEPHDYEALSNSERAEGGKGRL